jgi:hypothetical protein
MKRQRTTPAPAGLTCRKYGRFWAVYDQEGLVVVTVYRKGALAVIQRLTTQHAQQTAEEDHNGGSHP